MKKVIKFIPFILLALTIISLIIMILVRSGASGTKLLDTDSSLGGLIASNYHSSVILFIVFLAAFAVSIGQKLLRKYIAKRKAEEARLEEERVKAAEKERFERLGGGRPAPAMNFDLQTGEPLKKADPETAQKDTEKSAEQLKEEPAEKPAEQLKEEPVREKPAEKFKEEPVREKPAEKFKEETVEKAAKEYTERLEEKPAEKTDISVSDTVNAEENDADPGLTEGTKKPFRTRKRRRVVNPEPDFTDDDID